MLKDKKNDLTAMIKESTEVPILQARTWHNQLARAKSKLLGGEKLHDVLRFCFSGWTVGTKEGIKLKGNEVSS